MAGREGSGAEFASSWVRVDHHFLFSAEPRQPNVAEETVTTTTTWGGTYDTRARPTASVAHSPVSLCVCVPRACVCAAMCVTFIFAISHLTTLRPQHQHLPPTHSSAPSPFTHPHTPFPHQLSSLAMPRCLRRAQDINIFYHKRILRQRAKNNNNNNTSRRSNNNNSK